MDDKKDTLYKNWFRKFLNDNSNFLSIINENCNNYEDLKYAVESLIKIFDIEIRMMDMVSDGGEEKILKLLEIDEESD